MSPEKKPASKPVRKPKKGVTQSGSTTNKPS